nr:hypothetical transcript [Hymenolepis microstoma]
MSVHFWSQKIFSILHLDNLIHLFLFPFASILQSTQDQQGPIQLKILQEVFEVQLSKELLLIYPNPGDT